MDRELHDMDLGGYSDRWRHRAWQVEPASEDSATTSFDEYGTSEDLPTSSFLPTGAISTSSPAEAPPRQQAAAITYEIGPGSVLRDRYLIEKRIGEGGTAEVFSAIDRHRGNGSGGFDRLAIKILHSRYREDGPRTERLIREFRHMQRLTHSGIARVYDLDCENGLWFITMELLEGRSLSQRIRTGLKDGEALSILTQCAEALAYAHDHAVVHGDLKPSNIFVSRDGSIRLLDFGSVPSRNEAATQNPAQRRFAATPPYASPELLDGQEAEPRDDIFSLGCVAYELFSGGQHPFSRKPSLDARQLQLRPNYHSSMRPRHFAVIARALSWKRDARPSTARDFLHDFLASHFDHESASQAPTIEPNQASANRRDHDGAVAAKAPIEPITTQPKPTEPIAAATDSQLEPAEPIAAASAARPNSTMAEAATALQPKVAGPTEAAGDSQLQIAIPAETAFIQQPKAASPNATGTVISPDSAAAAAPSISALPEAAGLMASNASQPERTGHTAPAITSQRGPVSPLAAATNQQSPPSDSRVAATVQQSNSSASTASKTVAQPDPSGSIIPSAAQRLESPAPAVQEQSRLFGSTAASAAQQSRSAGSAAAGRESAARNYEEARARFAEPIPAELLVSPLRFAAEPSALASQLEMAGLRRPHLFWLRSALLAAVFLLTVLGAVFGWQQFSNREIRLQPAAPPPVRNTPPPVAPVAAPASAAAPIPAAVENPAPPAPQKRPPRQVGSVAFEATAIRVGPSQSIAAVNVRRTEAGTGPTQIVWSTVAGSARPDVDYESVDSQVVRFHQGQDLRSLYIAIKHPPGTDRERRFRIRLEKTTTGPVLGDPVEAEIIISGVPTANAAEF